MSFSSDATAAALTSLELPFAIPRARSLEPLASRPKAPARTLASCAAFSAAPPGAINGGLWRQGRRRTPGGSCRADRHLMTSPESSRRAVSTSASTVDRHPDVLTRRNKVGLPRSAWRLRLSSGCFLAMSCNYGPMDALVSASVPECNCRNNTQKKKETMRLGGGCCEIGPRRKLRAVGALSAGGPDSNSSPLSPHLSLLHPALMVPKSRARCFARARAPHPPRRSRAGPRTAGAEENRGRALMM